MPEERFPASRHVSAEAVDLLDCVELSERRFKALLASISLRGDVSLSEDDKGVNLGGSMDVDRGEPCHPRCHLAIPLLARHLWQETSASWE